MDKVTRISQKLINFWKKNWMNISDKRFESVAKKALTKEEYEMCFLSDENSKRVDDLAIRGDQYFDNEEYHKAIEIYLEGIEIIPEPRNNWETKLWFTAAIADSYWSFKEYEKALEYLDESLEVVGGPENSFIRLRRSQVLFELSRFEEAKQELEKLYKLDKGDDFNREDSKYFEWIKSS